jgi:hypothetical protein
MIYISNVKKKHSKDVTETLENSDPSINDTSGGTETEKISLKQRKKSHN